MKNPSIRHGVAWILVLLVVSTPFLVGTTMSSPETTTDVDPLPLLYLEPSNITKNPGETFTVDIEIVNITDLYNWGLTITWRNPLLLGNWLNVIKAEEGEFLKRGGNTTYWVTPVIEYTYSTIILGCTRWMAAPGETGNGTLATITFKVNQGGNCTLHVYDTKLFDRYMKPISHTTQDGYFYTTVPLAYFTYSPSSPRVTQPVTFNATLSYDPDGGNITSYYWDFGDGTNTTETDPITYHTYTEEGTYYANVTVTDDEEESWTSVSKPIKVWIRDIAITHIDVSPTKVKAGVPVNINVTAKNEGALLETFNLTAYYDGNIANKTTGISLGGGATTTLTLTWDTNGVPLGVYTIKAEAEIEFDCNLTNSEAVDGTVTVAPVSGYSFPVVVGGVTFHVIVETNSTVSNFAFNPAQKEISFNVSGPDDMSSFCNVTIPKVLLDGDFTVLIDGTPVVPDPIVTPIDAYHFVNFTYTLSTHTIQIKGTTVATPPAASFTVDPELPYVDKTVTFDATESNDPDGTIASYSWNFGDGTTDTGMTVTHTYTIAKTYDVTLTVTDNEGLNSNTTKSIKTYIVYDIAITKVTVSHTTANIGEIVSINVNVTNKSPGLLKVDLDVTVYFDNTPLETRSVSDLVAGYTEISHFIWNTTFVPEGTYTIKATASVTSYGTFSVFPDELNTDDNTFVYGDVTVQKWTSILSISASPTSFTVGEDTVINGSISPERAGVEVTILYRLSGSQTWSTLTTVLTNEDSEYSHTWTPDWAETYDLKANWTGDDITLPDESDIKTIIVNKTSSTISLSLNLSSIIVGSNITISGEISPAREGVGVTIQYSRDGEEWIILTTISTNSTGQYSYDWTPSEPGTYELKASWAGDANTLSDESDIKPLTVKAAALTQILLIVAVVIVIAIGSITLAFYFLRKPKQEPTVIRKEVDERALIWRRFLYMLCTIY